MSGTERTEYRQEPSAEEREQIIYRYTIRMASERKVGHLLPHLANMARELVVADRCSIWLTDEESDTLWTKVAHGVEEIRVPLNSGLIGYAVQTGEDILLADAHLDPRFNQEIDKQTGYHTQAVLVIPFTGSDGRILGAIQALNKMTPSGIFVREDITNLQLVASYATSFIENTWMKQEIDETQKEILCLMGEAGENRSHESGNHVKRVAEYSRILALGVGMSEAEAELLKMASPMHDIGKVGIPDEILKKPGKLTEDEFKIMQTHAEIGYNILKNSDRAIIRAAAIVAYEHHEKWAGGGYPRNLMGEGIHIYGRITAVADVFDALGSDRCYKTAWDMDRILALFHEENGRHFCPSVTAAFFAHLDEMLRVKSAFPDDKTE